VAPGEERAEKFLAEPLGGVKAAKEYAPEKFLDEGSVGWGERRALPAPVPDGIAHQGVEVGVEI